MLVALVHWGENRKERIMKCYECKWLDRSVILTSYPPQYGCTLGFGSHYADHECEYEFMPIVRCEDCKYGLGETKSGRGILCNYCSHGMLIERDKNWYCADGERKEK